MSDIEEELEALYDSALSADTLAMEVQLSGELYRIVHEWTERAAHLYGFNLAQSAVSERIQGNAAMSVANANRAIRFFEEEGTWSTALKIDLARSYNVLAWAAAEQARFSEAVTPLRQARGLLAPLLKDKRTRQQLLDAPLDSPHRTCALYQELADTYYTESTVHGNEGDTRTALKLNEQAAQYALKAVEVNPESRNHRLGLSVIADSLIRNTAAFGRPRDQRRVMNEYGPYR